MEYLAHYDKELSIKDLLHEHLLSVAREVKNRIVPDIKFSIVDNKKLITTLYWVAYLHDVGKYTDFFQ